MAIKSIFLKSKCVLFIFTLICFSGHTTAQTRNNYEVDKSKNFDPSNLIWFDKPAAKWEEALPLGNGRLGAMVYGREQEEIIQLNEESYWSGGPYSTVVKGGAEHLETIQKHLFNGEPLKAHKLFGRHLMGYPVEQQKYQSLANLHVSFEHSKDVSGYKRWLDLETGVSGLSYAIGDTVYSREVFASAPDQVIAIHFKSNKPNALSFKVQLRGCRNQTHSNYATDYFRMDARLPDELILRGKSADYLGVEGKIKYEAVLKAIPEGGKMYLEDDFLLVEGASSVTMYFVAATNFVNYKDLSANENIRIEEYLKSLQGKDYQDIKEAAIADYQNYYKRTSLKLPYSGNSYLPTNQRMTANQDSSDPSLAALAYHFGRYLIISSSRPGTQPANLQGIWNDKMNPPWDSKYTTNINTEMNYWPVMSGNLRECFEPLYKMMWELSDQGTEVAREHYGAKGWVFHQNTDLWRVAAPMDGPCWGTFTVGGAWLCNQLYDYYLYTMDREYLKEFYPLLKGAVDFFVDFLLETPDGKYLVTSPSTSPENPPKGPGYEYFFDEVTGFYYFTTICYGSSIDMQILSDLFTNYLSASDILGIELPNDIRDIKNRLIPPGIGKNGCLKEWAEDYGQMEDKHRHFSHLYGLYPGHVISPEESPDLALACEKVLEQRGDGATGFSRAWKMALWAQLKDGNRANKILKGYFKDQAYPQLFAKCGNALQVDGSLGVAAGITEMLVKSDVDYVELLPALPDEWDEGRFKAVCVRGGFQLDYAWRNKEVNHLQILSKAGSEFRIKTNSNISVQDQQGQRIKIKHEKGIYSFHTDKDRYYQIQFDYD